MQVLEASTFTPGSRLNQMHSMNYPPRIEQIMCILDSMGNQTTLHSGIQNHVFERRTSSGRIESPDPRGLRRVPESDSDSFL